MTMGTCSVAPWPHQGKGRVPALFKTASSHSVSVTQEDIQSRGKSFMPPQNTPEPCFSSLRKKEESVTRPVFVTIPQALWANAPVQQAGLEKVQRVWRSSSVRLQDLTGWLSASTVSFEGIRHPEGKHSYPCGTKEHLDCHTAMGLEQSLHLADLLIDSSPNQPDA